MERQVQASEVESASCQDFNAVFALVNSVSGEEVSDGNGGLGIKPLFPDHVCNLSKIDSLRVLLNGRSVEAELGESSSEVFSTSFKGRMDVHSRSSLLSFRSFSCCLSLRGPVSSSLDSLSLPGSIIRPEVVHFEFHVLGGADAFHHCRCVVVGSDRRGDEEGAGPGEER